MAVDFKRLKDFFARGVLVENDVGQVDTRFKERNVLVGVVRNKHQFNALIHKKFYHIPMSQLVNCEMPVKYVAIYQSKSIFKNMSGIKYYAEVISCNTVPRNRITELPKNSDEPYLYIKVKGWRKLGASIKAKEMNSTAVSTTMYLLKNAKDSVELTLRSAEEYEFYTSLCSLVKRLIRTNKPDHPDVIYRDFRVKLSGGCMYLYFAEALQCVIGFDVFIENPMDIVKFIFDYYPEIE
jgi:hypothetical protein